LFCFGNRLFTGRFIWHAEDTKNKKATGKDYLILYNRKGCSFAADGNFSYTYSRLGHDTSSAVITLK
jgi:hypothetical protein